MGEAAIEARAQDGQTRRRLQSRRRLLAAARELFVTRGYDRTRPQDIARAAGVASGTFYLHFRDKEDVFLAFAAEAQDDLFAYSRERLGPVRGVSARFRAFIGAMFTYAELHPGVLQAAFLDPVMIAPGDEEAWRLYDRFGRSVAAALAEAAGQGAIADDYHLPLISHALGGLIRHGTLFGRRSGLDPEQVADQLTRFISRGLGAPDGALASGTTTSDGETAHE